MFNILMQKCINLAKTAQGKVSPNPMVGAIVLDKDGNIVGEGYHPKYGEAHAEVFALNQAGEKAKGGTIIVNLEPCSYHGKTPPCADLIIEKGIKKLIVGMIDPNPIVSGNGIKKCQESGIEVEIGILEDKCKELNEVFIKNQTQKKPFITLKIATTLDGKIATKTGSSKWITSPSSREIVQNLRNQHDAILTGSGTVIADDPSMTCTLPNGKNPIKIVLDTNAKTNPNSKIYQEGRVILATSKNTAKYPPNVEILVCPLNKNSKIDIDFLLNELFKRKICSILVEAGAKINSAMLKGKHIDKIYHFMGPKILADNESIPCFEGFDVTSINDCVEITIKDIQKVDVDVIIVYGLT
ncbi:MAG: bifunctional diaminohydroxyphosphoribosylaminopyrimidine deaminase/5-amino-6-(5-phosphoribosylamino)uracil reductase RibD [Candidatus Gastranaerophilales bacterium]|nr:bifunctional diaminohydroxyphosphoribosylaminopyrimidine deaminase/5-amino-6-(5-phosphoribosylamino)uracil reductase RibD [Candidatus Gastranaerophilales bacterium]